MLDFKFGVSLIGVRSWARPGRPREGEFKFCNALAINGSKYNRDDLDDRDLATRSRALTRTELDSSLPGTEALNHVSGLRDIASINSSSST